MKFKKYKILFISPFNDKTWQSEFNRPTLIASLSLIAFSFIASLSLIILSIPIVKEYFRITAINKEIFNLPMELLAMISTLLPYTLGLILLAMNLHLFLQ